MSTRLANHAAFGKRNATGEVMASRILLSLRRVPISKVLTDCITDDPSPLPCARCRRESIQSHCFIAERRTRRFKLDELASRQVEHVHLDTDANSTARISTISSGQTIASSEPALQRNATDSAQNESPHSPTLSYSSIHHSQVASPKSLHSQSRGSGLETYHSSASGKAGSSRLNSQRNLTDNVIQTLVTKPNDALTLLFEAAGREELSALNSRQPSSERNLDDAAHVGAASTRGYGSNGPSPANAYATPRSTKASMIESLPTPPAEIVELWKRSRFVRQGWLSATQAVLYIDL